VGIGSENKQDTIDFVLGNSSGEERKLWLEAIERASQAAREFMTDPFQSVMNKYNRGEK
jgi:peptidyl-tRNA hydrolase